jgi:hypothetical protein
LKKYWKSTGKGGYGGDEGGIGKFTDFLSLLCEDSAFPVLDKALPIRAASRKGFPKN